MHDLAVVATLVLRHATLELDHLGARLHPPCRAAHRLVRSVMLATEGQIADDPSVAQVAIFGKKDCQHLMVIRR